VAMMNAAMKFTIDKYVELVKTLKDNGFDIPIVIGEIGWKSRAVAGTDNTAEQYLGHQVNQKMFYEALNEWVYGSGKTADGPKTSFFFAAFDEPWKGGDDGWGLFDTNRYAKYALWSQFPDKKPPNAPNITDNDAIYYNK